MLQFSKWTNFIGVLMTLLLLSCDKKVTQKKPWIQTIKFENYKVQQIGMTPDRIIDSAFWKNHQGDSLIYFKLNFHENSPTLIFKTNLVARNIPFLLKYSKLSDEKSVVEIVQQFNTVYSDSIILQNDYEKNRLNVKEVYKVVYPHNVSPEITQVPLKFQNDTLDITY